MSKNVVETIWPCDVTICMYAHAHTHVPGYPHARQHAHTDQELILVAFQQQQQWFCEHASMLCYSYIACLVTFAVYEVKVLHHAERSVSFVGRGF
jgi:hypothetical protein